MARLKSGKIGSEISPLDRMRIKIFCALLDSWVSKLSNGVDAEAAIKIGTLMKRAEKIKRMILVKGAKPKPAIIALDAITDQNKLSSCEIDEQVLKKIKNSIEIAGLNNLPIVRKANGGYQLLSGSLHYIACKRLNMAKIKTLVKDCDAVEAEELSLLDVFTRNGVRDLEPQLLNTLLRFYNQILN